MKVIIAIDSFKGSLSSMEAGKIASNSIKNIFPSAEIKVYPLADGGEGTVDALTDGLNGEIVNVEVTGPLGSKVPSRYGKINKTAIIEMADAAGLLLVPENERNPLNTTTYGLGELILRAAEDGCREFIIGIGGSATNDCGLGMLTALGFEFRENHGFKSGVLGRDLQNIFEIDTSKFNEIIKDCHFKIACDVNNPLTGANGCSAIYGPQKGATPEIISDMDKWIANFAALSTKALNIEELSVAGDGAAGGLGFAFRTFLNGELVKGIELVLDLIGIDDEFSNADLLITGEGRLDGQSVMGKAPVGVAQLAKSINNKIVTIAVCGCATDEAIKVHEAGIDAYFPILQAPMSTEEAMRSEIAEFNLSRTVEEIARLCVAR